MTDEPILTHEHGGIQSPILNRPRKRNTLDAASLDLLLDFLSRTPAPRLFIIRAVGDVFCAGADLMDPNWRDKTTQRTPCSRCWRPCRTRHSLP